MALYTGVWRSNSILECAWDECRHNCLQSLYAIQHRLIPLFLSSEGLLPIMTIVTNVEGHHPCLLDFAQQAWNLIERP
ncbi:hypothetical protein M378DRAFT_155037 [Amanita muscaria Koide BX008]|uniref:Uncharacterized protein n=1 Tax=Amanita muscaria (strain Koide BX008) TaxID=946122 RepID=A0A0C2XQI9_AMAMK|nr:hypothetical protein M378DRAFT_155037 [Amanita muscaria Koide BX008]